MAPRFAEPEVPVPNPANVADFVRRQRCRGANLSGDGIVDLADVDRVAEALGSAPGPSGIAAVPPPLAEEPGTDGGDGTGTDGGDGTGTDGGDGTGTNGDGADADTAGDVDEDTAKVVDDHLGAGGPNSVGDPGGPESGGGGCATSPTGTGATCAALLGIAALALRRRRQDRSASEACRKSRCPRLVH